MVLRIQKCFIIIVCISISFCIYKSIWKDNIAPQKENWNRDAPMENIAPQNEKRNRDAPMTNRTVEVKADEGIFYVDRHQVTMTNRTVEVKAEGGIFYLDRHQVTMPSSIPLIAVACDVSKKKQDHKVDMAIRVYLKSLALMNQRVVNVILVMNKNPEVVQKILSTWPWKYRSRLNITIVSTWFPTEELQHKYNFLCSSQRLVLAYMFPLLDAVVYTDVDVGFLRPISDVFQEFHRFDDQQFMSMSGSDYTCAAKTKICSNAGFLLMNFTRIRNYKDEVNWIQFVSETAHSVSRGSKLDDQYTLNQIRARIPHKFYALSVEWNVMYVSYIYADTDLATIKGWAIAHFVGNYYKSCPEAKVIFDLLKSWSMEKDLSMFVEELEIQTKQVVANRNIPGHSMKFPPQKYIGWVNYYPKRTLVENQSVNKVN